MEFEEEEGVDSVVNVRCRAAFRGRRMGDIVVERKREVFEGFSS